MNVSASMSAPAVSVTPGTTIGEAARHMGVHGVGCLVVTEHGALRGIVTDRDIAVRGVAEGRGPDTPVRDLMSDDIICARQDDDVHEIAQRMSKEQVRRLPVLDENDRLCGIVSLGDLARESRGEAAQEALEGVSQPGGQHEQ